MADDWSAFTAAPAQQSAPAAVVAQPAAPAASDDGWAAFTAPPAAAGPQKYDEYDSKGQWIGTSEEGFQSQNAKPQGGPGAAPRQPDTAVPQSGYLANLGAGGNAAVASTLGLPVDIATGGINLATRGINAVTGSNIPEIVDPVGGSGSIKRALGVVGANPDDVKSDGIGQEIARGVGGGIVSAAIPAGAVAGAVRGGVMAAPTAARVLTVLGDATPQNALLGAASGGVGEAAASQVPGDYKPVAGLAGGLAGVGVPLAGIAAGRGLVRAAGDFVAPAVGRVNPLLDVAGGAITGADGAPLNMLSGQPLAATPNQVQIAGQRLQDMATDPEAARVALATQGPPVIADQPTTAQLTRDPGLLAAERGISRTTPQAQAPFLARAAAQNDARVGVVRGVAEGGDPEALPAALQRQTADADAAAASRVGTLQQTADQARAGIGGDLPPGSEGQVGAAVRAPIDAANQAAKARESALWNQIDPDGTLAVDMTPVKAGAGEILGEMSPNAAPLAGNEAGIFETASNLPAVQSFRDLGALRSRITDAIRQERDPAGDPQAVRRMSMLLGHVQDAMEGGATAADNIAAVGGVQVEPEQTAMSRLAAVRDAWYAERENADRQTKAALDTGTSGRNAAGRSGGVSPVVGSVGETGGRSGGPSGTQGLQGQSPLTPNFDAEAQARYTAARQATADRAATFKTPPGVREALQGGPQAGTFRMPDTSVPATFIRVGPEGAARVQSYLAAGGSPEALSDAAAFSLRRDAARPDGTLDPDKYAAWSKQRSSFLSALPDAKAKFGAAADAQQTVDAAVAARAEQAKAVQRSVIGKFLGDADPVTRVAAVLRSPTAVADMRTLADRVANDPDAKAGLQRTVAEHILRDLKGNTAGAGGEEAFLKGDQLQTFLRTREPALREVLTPAQMTSLRSVAESLERSNLSVSGSRLAGGSDTVQNAAAGATTLLGNFMHQAVTHAGTTAGGALGFIFGGGPVGALAGAAVGRVGDWGVQAARAAGAAGMHTVDDLVANAMLHPQLAAVLLAKVTPNNRESLGRALVSQLRRISLVSAAVGRQDEDRAQKNALLR
jgi:hypothetical protein